jgi:hypothetical protein
MRKPVAVSAPGVYGSASWFVSVTTSCADISPTRTLPKSCAATETARSRPVPLSAPDVSTGPFVLTCSVVVRAPVVAGSNATRMRQLSPAASGAASRQASSVTAK